MNPYITSKSNWKLPCLKDKLESLQLENYDIPFIAVTETWLKPVVTDKSISICNYNIFRTDRDNVLHGGVLLYVHHKIPIDTYECFDDSVC